MAPVSRGRVRRVDEVFFAGNLTPDELDNYLWTSQHSCYTLNSSVFGSSEKVKSKDCSDSGDWSRHARRTLSEKRLARNGSEHEVWLEIPAGIGRKKSCGMMVSIISHRLHLPDSHRCLWRKMLEHADGARPPGKQRGAARCPDTPSWLAARPGQAEHLRPNWISCAALT